MQYLVPLRVAPGGDVTDLARYLRALPLPVLVVDGSDAEQFASNHRQFGPFVTHVRPDPDPSCANGKVAGVVSGLRRCTEPLVVIADDDVRHTATTLAAIETDLAVAEIVRPQNTFLEWPWHAREDAARSLLNRVFGADHPGTFGLRIGDGLRQHGYDGDVLFENLELVRTVRADGGRESSRPDVYVGRRAPDTRHFVGQRLRQAYDSWAEPPRFVVELALLPGFAAVIARSHRRWRTAAGAIALPVLLAEIGRRRHGGRTMFPPDTALWAPVWCVERGTLAWAASALGVSRRGVPYAGRRFRVAAHSLRTLRRRRAARP